MKEHAKDRLSAFIDGRLPDAERRMVEAHVERCAECGAELKDLRSLTRLLAASPAQPLPVGFRERLERRRRSEAAAEREPPRWFLPKPARMLAFGMSAAVVCLVAYDALKGPGRLAAPLEADVEKAASSRLAKEADEPAAPASAPQAAASAPLSAERGSAAKLEKAPGSPIGVLDSVPRDYTNEELQTHLETERKKLGIAEIVPRGGGRSAGAGGGASAPPMNAAEARSFMRQMAEDVARQRRAMGNFREAVPIGEGTKPRLLSEPSAPAAASAGRPLAADIPAPTGPRGRSMDGALDKTASLPRGNERPSRGELEASAGIAQAPVSSLGYSGLSGGSSGSKGPSPAALADRGSAKAKADARAPSAAPAAHAASSFGELDALWRRLGKTGPLPAVDFSSEMVVAVSGPAAIEIVRALPERGRLVIEYREDPENLGPASAFRVVPKSDLRVELRRLR
ncbi:MAG: zf-HC2 domain-containing protein [Elusimicrobia bacterium]|nr:zf-HC2 domain-containing protein [Elusimicrobiota bacterium]